MKLSKSKVNTYLKCPLEFKFQYIDEIEVPQNKYMALGSDVHLIAEKFSEKFEAINNLRTQIVLEHCLFDRQTFLVDKVQVINDDERINF